MCAESGAGSAYHNMIAVGFVLVINNTMCAKSGAGTAYYNMTAVGFVLVNC